MSLYLPGCVLVASSAGERPIHHQGVSTLPRYVTYYLTLLRRAATVGEGLGMLW